MATEKKTTTKKVAAAKKETPKSEAVSLNAKVWKVKFNPDLVAQVLNVQRSNARVGTASAKTRGDVRGGGKKPWRQKGTGRARAGSIRSPLWVKGGVTFVPNNRNWSRKINKKMVKKAIAMLLSERLRNEQLEFVNIGNKKELKGIRDSVVKEMDKGLLIGSDQKQKMALNNVKGVNYVNAKAVSVVHLVGAKRILVEKDQIKVIEDRILNEK